MGALDAIDAASPKRETVEVILDAALEDEWFALKTKLNDAATKDAQAGDASIPATREVAARMEEIRDRVEASRVFFVFERVAWQERVALQLEHPPRDGNRLDESRGYNVETYTPAIITRACLGVRGEDVEEELAEVSPERWERLLGKPTAPGVLNYGQVNRLYAGATNVNDGVSKVPMSARSLLETPDSGASSTPSRPGPARPRSGPKAGSRRTSPRSRTTKKAASSG